MNPCHRKCESMEISMGKKFSLSERLDQAEALLSDSGVTLEKVISAMGMCRTQCVRIVTRLCREGRAFRCRVKIDEDAKDSKRYALFFRTAESRDAHEAAYNDRMRAKALLRQREYSNAYKIRNAEKLREDRKAMQAQRTVYKREYRARLRAERIAAAAQRLVERQNAAGERMLRTAEAELAKVRARQVKEAAAAEKQRLKAEAKTQREKLKALTRAAGQLAKLKGTASPAPAKPRGPAHLEGPADESRAKVFKAPTPKSRFHVEDAQPCFSSLKPGQYLAPAPAWVEAVAA